jgi:hypothetical protein
MHSFLVGQTVNYLNAKEDIIIPGEFVTVLDLKTM